MNALKSLLFLALSIFIVNINGVYAQTDGVNYVGQFKGGLKIVVSSNLS